MKVTGPAAILVVGLALAACDPSDRPEARNEAATPITGDAELDRKIAEAKAAFDKLSPEEKAKLARDSDAATKTLPLPLAGAASLPVIPAGAPATTFGKVAPPGKPTIVAAWASWCVPCKVEARQLAQLRRQYGPEALNIVYLNIGDPKVEAEKAPKFLKDAGAEVLGLTMLSTDDFKKLTRLEQISIPRVLPYDRRGQPKLPILGLNIPMDGGARNAIDPHLAEAVKAITS
jgi:thiol-disulfide isomerase/thioredoxin